jgi:hypothetical protein
MFMHFDIAMFETPMNDEILSEDLRVCNDR